MKKLLIGILLLMLIVSCADKYAFGIQQQDTTATF